MTTPELSHEIELVPAFHDIDSMDVVWHGHYVKYLELARCALLDKFDYGYRRMRESGYAWPIVDLRMKYSGPAGFDQPLVVRAQIVEWESRLKMDYTIRDARTGKRIHSATSIQVAVDIATRQMQYVCPRVLWERLGVAPC
jgi:acyl-CoA thioester hydrolase